MNKYQIKNYLLKTSLGKNVLKINNKFKKLLRIIFALNSKLYYSFRKNKRLLFPDFMIIGSQKCGTTWLSEMLKKHPLIYIPKKKEIHFFDSFYDLGYFWYSYFFEKGREKIKGEATPAYGILDKKMIEKIKQKNPQLKIILLIRNPLERSWSSFKMEELKFKGRYFKKISEEEMISHLNSERSKALGDYLKIISNWSKYFPKKQIKIFFYDEINENPSSLLEKIFKFLEIENLKISKKELNKRYNVNKVIKIPKKALKILKDNYRKKIIEIDNFFKNKYTKNWMQSLN